MLEGLGWEALMQGVEVAALTTVSLVGHST